MQEAPTFVMLDVIPPGGQLFEAGKQQGIQAEQRRVYRFFHEKLSPVLIAAIFFIKDLAEELEAIRSYTEILRREKGC
jgi:hypothetical protein